MHWKASPVSWKSALLGALSCALLGWFLFETGYGNGLKFLSYDLLFRLRLAFFRPAVPTEALIIYLDDDSFAAYGQSTAKAWDLRLHAQMVDFLTMAKARAVVFDVVFNLQSPAEHVAEFARAIKRNGHVVLAASLEPQARGVTNSVSPLDELQDAASEVGYALVSPECVRYYHRGTPHKPSLHWATARAAGLDFAKDRNAQEPDTWLRYYGPRLTLPHKSYVAVTNQPLETFSGKCVFIGALPKTLMAQQEADSFKTPYPELMPGVEIGATAFLNLLHGDGLKFWNDDLQALLILAAGIVFGGGFALLRPWVASALGAVCLLGLLFVAVFEFKYHHAWFTWAVLGFAQIPAALAWSIGGQFIRLRIEKEVVTRTLQETTKLVESTRATAAQKAPFTIPDHSLVRLVGRGAYGEVWLARNAIGAYHVVKLVKRRGFPSDEPYEREFRGIQKFMPISRTHAGFVHILHVGRNDDEKFFYCIMEAGDDRTAGQAIDPNSYQPKTLATEMEKLGMLPPALGLHLGISLSNALEHLHRQQLIHRDIKPPNIIYVNGVPKFADIGLVTDIAGDPKDISQIGTEGYMAPEGPGTPTADVYSLGKVLYEAVMGRDRRMFPEVPTAVFEQPADSLVRRFNEIIFRACEENPARRYATARELYDALCQLAAEQANR